MNLSDYRAQAQISQEGLATLLSAAGSDATQSLISHWETGLVKVPPDRWKVIEQITGGKVTKEDLRPDIFGPAPTDKGVADAA